jgi:hypothetical protein
MGSLYHFAEMIDDLLGRIKHASKTVDSVEPVVNWTHARGLRGWLARRLTRVGDREVRFRFDAHSLTRMLETRKDEIGFAYRTVDKGRDMVVEVVWSN